ncbi:response regulator [Pseudothauera rhizosphaerae]|uniref:Response regulator transcription factor n=1 Tax=Pseudothauera rhizosphaerae TaxID=2565932 RepID=A0A4S4ALL6_9RHOO|nr:response regulator transcription factor [Pseudothauera rhizosphaerae]THF60332.1 response regulator transcription factor [Pseudothauera rhizosphaerae]
MHKISVLLADDHAIIRDGLKQLLADTDDISVEGEAANGNEVLALVRECDWDLVLLDISMPGRSGLDLIKVLKEERPDLRILVLSMHHEEQYAVRALHAGASGYLTKESDSEVVIGAVRRVAGGGVYMSDKVAELMVRDRQPATEPLPHTRLSDREYQVFDMLVSGLGLTEIGERLSLSVKTISTHKTHIFEKMNVSNTAALIHYAIAHHLTKTEEY